MTLEWLRPEVPHIRRTALYYFPNDTGKGWYEMRYNMGRWEAQYIHFDGDPHRFNDVGGQKAMLNACQADFDARVARHGWPETGAMRARREAL